MDEDKRRRGEHGFSMAERIRRFLGQSIHVKDVTQYIESQAEHHRKMTFQDELRALFQRHGIEFDERYVWD